jgi:hypothetical protein
MKMLRRAWPVLFLALTTAAAGGETIFRCGDSYSLTPCANARAIEAAAPVSPAQRAEARAVAAREKQLALEMVRDRQERERVRPATAASLGPSPAARTASAPHGAKKHVRNKKKAPADEDARDFVAAVPKAKP